MEGKNGMDREGITRTRAEIEPAGTSGLEGCFQGTDTK
jgi:hypothetical protein